jgi:hypothetical protein
MEEILMGNAFPSILTVIQRAIALQLIIDRGWTEHHLLNGDDNEKDIMEMTRETVLKWKESSGISQWLSDKEKRIWEKRIGELNQSEIAFCTWQLESLVPLLWALGLIDTLPKFSTPAEDRYYDILHFTEDKPVEKIVKDMSNKSLEDLFRKSAEIEVQSNLYMLVNWCCTEFLVRKNKRINMNEVPKQIFGEWINQAVTLLPINKKGDLIVERYNLVLKEMRKHDVMIIRMMAEHRQHALNWLLGEGENWDEVSTDT